MTIIVFLVDTSASMNQRTYLRMSLLDIAKGAVETFMKIRARDPASRMDRYMLLTFEDPPANVKAGWKESHATFSTELKNLEANGLTTLGPSLKHTFDLLNVNRMQSGIDTYGQGRCPFYLEPAVIVCITDGRKLSTQSNVQAELNLPMMNAVPGSELTKEPFRWDQRLFGIVLRVPAVPPQEVPGTFIPAAEDSPIDCMCDVMGGRSYAVTSQRVLHQCLESIVQKVQPGVVISFEKTGPDPTPLEGENVENKPNGGKENQDANRLDVTADDDKNKRAVTPTPSSTVAGSALWHSCRKLILVPRSAQKGYSVGHWPIPEGFWPDLNSPNLPPRTAHPVIKFTCSSCEPLVVENFPFDKYELEPSPLTQYILERRQPNTAWQVFVSNSAKYSEVDYPFGYLKASSNMSTVNLFVMPYNYPVILPLLDDLFKIHKAKPTQAWRQKFDNYLKTMPIYYAQPLRRALQRLGVSNLVPDQLDNCLSYSVVSYLKKLKNQAKVEYERLVNSVGQRVPQAEGIRIIKRNETSLLQRKDFKEIMAHYGSNMAMLKQEITEFPSFKLAVPDKLMKTQPYKNAYDIQRNNLIDQLSRMRANFYHSDSSGPRLQDQESLHSIAIGTMGNYQDYLKRMQAPLRELETAPTRQHMFGNPFKVNKNLNMIDEADEAMPGQKEHRRRNSTSSSHSDHSPMSPLSPQKRKAGPLPRCVPYRHLLTPPPVEEFDSPLSSPTAISPPDFLLPTKRPRFSEKDDTIDLTDEVFEGDTLNMHNNHDENQGDLQIDFMSNNTDYKNSFNSAEPTSDAYNKYSVNSIKKNNKKKLKSEREHNLKLREIILKEIKRPGKNFEVLLEKLSDLQGSLDTKTNFIHDVMHEASRFKRRTLISVLDSHIASLKKGENKSHKKNNTVASNHIGVKTSPNR